MPHRLPPLPYEKNALEPYISAQTLSFHHEKHHQTYVTNLNNLLVSHPLERASLEEVIMHAAGQADHLAIFNNAAQVWNHTFYWHCLTPQGGGQPKGPLAEAIQKSFGSFDAFCQAFKSTALAQFGSGWAWLVRHEDNTVSLMKTANADIPMAHGVQALLTCDVWEHAYYLDYQNRRADYVDTFLNHLVHWSFCQKNFEGPFLPQMSLGL